MSLSAQNKKPTKTLFKLEKIKKKVKLPVLAVLLAFSTISCNGIHIDIYKNTDNFGIDIKFEKIEVARNKKLD